MLLRGLGGPEDWGGGAHEYLEGIFNGGHLAFWGGQSPIHYFRKEQKALSPAVQLLVWGDVWNGTSRSSGN